MARYVFKLPDVGEGIAEAEVVKWHVNVGDTVKEGDAFVDIMTDKATVEISAPASGRLSARNGEEGSRLAVGSELAVLETENDAIAAETTTGSAARSQAVPPPRRPPHPSAKALASPAVRARAKALRLDLAAISGSGPDGRVEHGDIDKLLSARKETPVAALALNPLEEGAEDIKIFGIRRRIAERMLESKRRIPHFAYVEEVNVQALETLRAALNEKKGDRPRLTVLPFIVRAVIMALPSHPNINCHFDDASGVIRRFRAVHAGIATQTGRGLLVPVIRHAETMDVWRIAAEIERLSTAAREGKADRSELMGSTITVTSLGALGGIMATPIINPPEVAVIGVNRIAERAVVIDGRIEVRKMMNLSSCFDHRIVDGYQAAAFIADVRKLLEQPDRLASR